jgi:hypothetical protein
MKRLIRTLFLWHVAACLLLSAQGCKKKCHDRKNPECENYDLCIGKTPVKTMSKHLHAGQW